MMPRILRRVGLWPAMRPEITPETVERESRAEQTRRRVDRLLEDVKSEIQGYSAWPGVDRRTGGDRRQA